MTKSLNRSINKKFTAFNNAKKCQCGEDECLQKHRICHLCDNMVHWDVQVNIDWFKYFFKRVKFNLK